MIAKIKYVLFASALMAGTATSMAQATYTDKDGNEYQFKKHFYLDIQGGGQYTLGEAKFKDLLSPNIQGAIGYQFSPVFGLRAQMNGLWSKGGWAGFRSKVGEKPYNAKYKFKYIAPGVDFMFNLSNLFCGWNPNRVFNISAFAGGGINWAGGNQEINDIAATLENLNDYNLEYLWQGKKVRPYGRAGIDLEFKVSKAIETAQKKIETNNFGIRSHLLEYDQVMNEQREIMYAERRRVLDGESMRNSIMKMITDYVENVVNRCVSEDKDANEWDYDEINELLLPTIPIERVEYRENIKNKNELIHDLKEKAVKLYEDKEALFPEAEQIREIERVILLKVIDRKWMDHIDDMEILRQGIGLVGYGQRDPVVEYKMSAFEMFNNMISSIQEDTVRMLYHVHVEQKIEREQVAKVTGTNKDDTSVKKPVQRKEDKVYPNDPCPCGSGKKYKQCCGRKLMKA